MISLEVIYQKSSEIDSTLGFGCIGRNSRNGKQMMGPRDLFIFTTGMAGGPNTNVELLLAAKGSSLPEEKWSPDGLTPPVPYTRDGFYAVIRGGPLKYKM